VHILDHEDVACDLQRSWGLSPELARKISFVFLDWTAETRIGISILSGARTPREQEELIAQGRPAAPVGQSTHTTCPSQGADIRINGFVTNTMKIIFGRIVFMNGLRWGGGSPIDPETGIPSDWNHIDTGPRRG